MSFQKQMLENEKLLTYKKEIVHFDELKTFLTYKKELVHVDEILIFGSEEDESEGQACDRGESSKSSDFGCNCRAFYIWRALYFSN